MPETLFFVVFFAIVIYFGYRVMRHGGFKAAMFGARIEHTVGEVAGERVKSPIARISKLKRIAGEN